MFTGFIKRFKDAATTAVTRLVRAVREAVQPKSALGGLIADLTRTPDELRAENAALRQQVIALSRPSKKPNFKPVDCVPLVVASASTHRWSDAILVAKPDTTLRRACWWCVTTTHQARHGKRNDSCSDGFIPTTEWPRDASTWWKHRADELW